MHATNQKFFFFKKSKTIILKYIQLLKLVYNAYYVSCQIL